MLLILMAINQIFRHDYLYLHWSRQSIRRGTYQGNRMNGMYQESHGGTGEVIPCMCSYLLLCMDG